MWNPHVDALQVVGLYPSQHNLGRSLGRRSGRTHPGGGRPHKRGPRLRHTVSHIYPMVGGSPQVPVVRDGEHRVAGLHQRVDGTQQARHIVGVQAPVGLVHQQ